LRKIAARVSYSKKEKNRPARKETVKIIYAMAIRMGVERDSNNVWSPFNKIRCISLKCRPDRHKRVSNRFKELGVAVEFFQAIRHPLDPRTGCAESHRQCIQEAYNEGVSNILIFEDDVVFNDVWEEVVRDCGAFVEFGKEFDALLLGSTPYYITGEIGPFWRGVGGFAHAYCVSRSGMAKYLASPSINLKCNHDLLHGMCWTNIYMHKSNHVITQEFIDSDNDWGFGWNQPYTAWMQTKIIPRVALCFDHIVVWSRTLPLCIRPLCKPHGNFPIPVPLAGGEVWMATSNVFIDSVAIVLGLCFGLISSPPKGIVHFLWEAPVAYYRRCRGIVR